MTTVAIGPKETLLLNSNYAPLTVISWRRAFNLYLKDRVEILEEYDDFDLKSFSFTMKCPAVVRLLKYVGFKRRPRFSRINIFRRDKFQCQYCLDEPGIKNLTFDHVVPKSQDGKTTWNNITTSCVACNYKKAGRTPEQARMKLCKVPVIPTEQAYIKFSFDLPKTPEAWRSYLYWTTELKE